MLLSTPYGILLRIFKQNAFLQLRDGMRKHYENKTRRKKIKSVHHDDGQRFFISKQTRPQDKITASPIWHILADFALFCFCWVSRVFAMVKNSNIMLISLRS